MNATRGSRLQKVSVLGGPPEMLTRSLSLVHGASWGINGQIIFGTEVAGLFRVSESGEQPEVLTTLDPEQNETSHRWPFIIPGREAVLFVISTGQPRTTGQLAVLDLATREVRRLGVAGVSPHYVPTGHLVYAGADEALRAVPFDATSLEVTGNPVPLVDGVLVKDSGAADFDISDNGRLVYVPGNVVENDDTLVLVDRDGNAAPLIETPGAYYLPRLSPDGRRVAVVVGREIKICEIDSGRCPRLTADGQTPVWSPDGAQVAFTSNRGGDFLDLYLKPADGTAEAERLLERAGNQFPTSWSLDGVLAFSDIGDGGIDVLLLPLGGEPDTSFATSFTGSSATFSPNGRWVAYKSNESGDL